MPCRKRDSQGTLPQPLAEFQALWDKEGCLSLFWRLSVTPQSPLIFPVDQSRGQHRRGRFVPSRPRFMSEEVTAQRPGGTFPGSPLASQRED